MGIVGYIAAAVVTLLIIRSLTAANTFKSRTLRLAFEALRKNIDAFPEDSTEYFPPRSVIKATLAESFDFINPGQTLLRRYSTVTPELAAYHILDYVGHLFDNERPNMASWCFAAKDSLEPDVERV